MPHTRSYKSRTFRQDALEIQDILQQRETSTGPWWNEYLNWDLPEFTYQAGSSAETSAPIPHWHTSDGTTAAQTAQSADAPGSARDATNFLSSSDHNQSASAEFCGLERWYSSATQDLASASSNTNTKPQVADSAYSSYESTLFCEADSKFHQSTADLTWSPEPSRELASLSEASTHRKRSSTKEAESNKDLEDSLRPSSAEEIHEASVSAKLDTSRKRKIAHSLIEKNYRSRINDGMAELRDCVPSTWKGRTFSLDSSKTEVQRDDKAQQNHSSGKVATLSDAVQYVKSLELRNKTLHGRLDVLQRRNDTLQRIALSKVDTSRSPKDEAMEEPNYEDVLQLAEESLVPNRRKRSKTSASGLHRP